MDLLKLKQLLEDQPAYRLKQAQAAIFQQLIEDWSVAFTLPEMLRNKLAEELPLEIKSEFFTSKDKNSVKAQIILADNNKIETVLLRHSDHNTVCLSSQVGCALGCLFCATGQAGFKRDLTSSEIIEQVLLWARYLREFSQKVDNIVFMGMGEPLLNYDEVMAAIKQINSPDTFNIGSRHISISTIGIIPGIKKLATEKIQINLAVSLHAPNDELRSKIIPANKKYNLGNLINALAEYLKKTNRQLMIEYLFLKEFNDQDEQIRQLITLLQKLPKHLIVINLIQYNPTMGYKASDPAKIKKNQHLLQRNGFKTTVRLRLGREIKGACGQLVSS